MEESAKKTPSFSEMDPENSGILMFKDKRYAVGMTWLTCESISDSSMLNERSKKLDADFYVLRSSLTNQQGFGYLYKGHKIGMPSGAAIAADSLVGEWHGVFAADNCWWYLAVHADAIAPDGDRIFFSEEDAYKHFVKKNKDYKWPRSYAPAAWNLPEVGEEIPIDKLLEASDAPYTLRPSKLDAVFGGKRNKNLALFAALLFLIATIIFALLPSVMNQGPALSSKPKITVTGPVPDIIAPPPREMPSDNSIAINFSGLQLPLPSSVIRSCLHAFDRIVHPVPGWQLQSVQCDGTFAEATWRKGGGGLGMIKDALEQFPDEASKQFSGTNEFRVRLTLDKSGHIIRTVNVISRDRAILLLDQRFSDDGQMRVSHQKPQPPQQRNTARIPTNDPPPAPPPYLDIDFVTETPPSSLMSLFDLPGLRLQNIIWDVRNRNWTYQSKLLFDSEALRAAQELQ